MNTKIPCKKKCLVLGIVLVISGILGALKVDRHGAPSISVNVTVNTYVNHTPSE